MLKKWRDWNLNFPQDCHAASETWPAPPGATTPAVCPADSEVRPVASVAGTRGLQHTTAAAVMRDVVSCVMLAGPTRVTTPVNHVVILAELVKRISPVNVQVKFAWKSSKVWGYRKNYCIFYFLSRQSKSTYCIIADNWLTVFICSEYFPYYDGIK